MTTSTTPFAHLARIYELLIATYGEPKNEPDYDPLGGLIGTILSQHTSDINSERAYHRGRSMRYFMRICPQFQCSSRRSVCCSVTPILILKIWRTAHL